MTYGTTLAPSGYHRITDVHSEAANVNPGPGRVPVYLWVKRSRRGLPITGVAVLHGDADPPASYTRVAQDIGRGGGVPVHIAFTTEPSTPPGTLLGDMVVCYGNGTPGACGDWGGCASTAALTAPWLRTQATRSIGRGCQSLCRLQVACGYGGEHLANVSHPVTPTP